MTDFAVTNAEGVQPDDKTWAASRHGFNTAGSGTLNVAAFVADGVSVVNGVIPSGTAVRLVSGKYEPLTAASQVATRIVLESIPVKVGQVNAAAALIDHGIIYPARVKVGKATAATFSPGFIVR